MGLLRDVGTYLVLYRRWWLAPLLLAVILVGALVAFSLASPLSPFLYPLF